MKEVSATSQCASKIDFQSLLVSYKIESKYIFCYSIKLRMACGVVWDTCAHLPRMEPVPPSQQAVEDFTSHSSDKLTSQPLCYRLWRLAN